MDLYNILELQKGASKDEIKKAYRKLAMKYHPDRNAGDKEAEKKFKEINEAYQVLGDDAKRQQYDTFGSTGGGSGFGGAGGVNVDISDIFESFFGGGMGGNRNTQRSQEVRGEDLEYMMHIDLKTSIYGGKQNITLEREITCDTCDGVGGKNKTTCRECGGSGFVTHTQQSVFGTIQQRVTCQSCHGTGETFEEICETCRGTKRVTKKQELEIDIPAGIDHGMVIKINGEGNHGIGTKAHGDLYIKFQVQNEEKGLSRDGNDLYYTLQIDVVEAVLGTTKEITLPILGKRKIEVPSGTSHGNILTLVGDGVKDVSRDHKGDLHITFEIKIPQKLSKTERELYESLAKEKKINVHNKKGVLEKLFG
ncbi:J domain-containing protein [Candidatus Gracilibacteria bacterium]|nr:J domain-containing protein [Candidatus Gracilibacteria bacterium]